MADSKPIGTDDHPAAAARGGVSVDRPTEIRERLAAATPGEWRADLAYQDAPDMPWSVYGPNDEEIVEGYHHNPSPADGPKNADAQLIAHAPADLAYLLDIVERLRHELAWYGEQARLARLITSDGDSGRNSLAADGGKRASAALAAAEGGSDAS